MLVCIVFVVSNLKHLFLLEVDRLVDVHNASVFINGEDFFWLLFHSFPIDVKVD